MVIKNKIPEFKTLICMIVFSPGVSTMHVGTEKAASSVFPGLLIV